MKIFKTLIVAMAFLLVSGTAICGLTSCSITQQAVEKFNENETAIHFSIGALTAGLIQFTDVTADDVLGGIETIRTKINLDGMVTLNEFEAAVSYVIDSPTIELSVQERAAINTLILAAQNYIDPDNELADVSMAAGKILTWVEEAAVLTQTSDPVN